VGGRVGGFAGTLVIGAWWVYFFPLRAAKMDNVDQESSGDDEWTHKEINTPPPPLLVESVPW
jgi:hypothetical protein